ncbi:MAG: tetratricopeptide repeat protein [Bacteroidales bacterium]|nr:tetratricopeptide repeat protein [Bacteroidales bacterium]
MIESQNKYWLTFLIIFLFAGYNYSQNLSKIDSLNNELAIAKYDTSKVTILCELFWEYRRLDPNTAIGKAKQALEISQKANYTAGIAKSLHNIGIFKKANGEYKAAFDLLEQSKYNYEKIKDTTNLITCLIDIGDIYFKQSDYVPAIKYFDEARKLTILKKDNSRLSRIYHILGSIFKQQKQYEKALEYYVMSLDINKKSDFKLGMSVNYLNIGSVYLDMKEFSMAMENYLKALEIKKAINDYKGIATTLNNIGMIYLEQKEFQKALVYHNQAYNKYKELDDKTGIAISFCNLANDYLGTNNIVLALKYANESLKLMEDVNSLQIQTEIYRILSEIHTQQQQYHKALQYHKKYKLFNDSIVNIEAIRQITEMESKFEVEKKEKEITLLNAEKEKQDLQIQKQNLQRNLMFGIILLILSVLIFLFWVFRNKQKLNRKLEELNLTKSRFFANISHEFRTPLTLLLGPLEKLMDKAKNDDKGLFEMMYRNATRLLFLDNQLLDLSKLEAGKLNLMVTESEITQDIKGMVMSFQSLSDKKNIVFKTVFPEHKIQAFFDHDKLEKIIYNLLSNALKFTPEKGKVNFDLSLISKKMELPNELRKIAGQIICISVNDTGPGISKEKQLHIFDRFYQVDSGYNRNFEGSGLGLSLTKELVELHKGKIIVDSKPAKGSTFTVYLPIDKNAYSIDEIAKEQEEVYDKSKYFSDIAFTETTINKTELDRDSSVSHSEEDKVKVLIVEDNSDMRSYISICFDDNFTIIEADNGKSGFKAAINEIPDIIISDLMMPKMDGIELCRELKTDERTSHIPIILLTALASIEDRIKGLETGADDYIAKPFNRQELVIRVQNLSKQRQLLRERFSKEIKIQPKDITITSADEKFLNNLIAFIEKNIANPDLNVDSLLKEIYLSRAHLHRKLKALTNLSATEFIRNIRLKRAAQLLEQKHGSIAEVVYAVGFNNQSYFSKCFLKEFGVNPKEFITLHK